VRRLESLDLTRNFWVAGDVDDEVQARVGNHRAKVSGNRDVEPAGQIQPGCPRIGVGDPENRDGRIAAEHLEEGSAALPRPDDHDLGHAASVTIEVEGATSADCGIP
jgi:hypothetical protein